jgi:hypothetical protein
MLNEEWRETEKGRLLFHLLHHVQEYDTQINNVVNLDFVIGTYPNQFIRFQQLDSDDLEGEIAWFTKEKNFHRKFTIDNNHDEFAVVAIILGKIIDINKIPEYITKKYLEKAILQANFHQFFLEHFLDEVN